MTGRIGAVLLFALIPLSAGVLVAGYLLEAQPPRASVVNPPPLSTAPDPTALPTATHAPGPTPHPAARDGAAWAAADGRVVGAGGRGPGGLALDSVTSFDGAAWTDLPPLPEPRVRAALVAMADGRLLLFGGTGDGGATDTTFVLEPGTGAWTVGTPMPYPQSSMMAVALGERAFLLGGAEPAHETDVLVYDPGEATWSAAAAIPTILTDPVPAVFDGQLYLFGGEDASGAPSAAAFRYDPASDAWAELPPMPGPASDAPTATIDDRIWILSPRFDDARSVDTLVVFEPRTERWLLAEGPTGFAAAVVDVTLPLDGGRILLVGAGADGFSVSVLSTAPMVLREP